MRRKRDTADAGPDDDAALFRAAIGEVRELPSSSPPPRPPAPAPAARMRRRDEVEALHASRRPDPALAEMLADGVLAWCGPRLPRSAFRRLRRGEYRIDDELDLHGLDERAAQRLLRAFLAHASRCGWRCLRIIHGKGLGSVGGGSVLRPLVAQTLGQRADALAFVSAPANQGGSGATLVLLADRRAGT